MYIKPLYIYEYTKGYTESNIVTYIITNQSKDLVKSLFLPNIYIYNIEYKNNKPFVLNSSYNLNLGTFDLCCLMTEDLFRSSFDINTKRMGNFCRIVNSFLYLRKLRYDEAVELLMTKKSKSIYDETVRDMISQMLLYWDDWN